MKYKTIVNIQLEYEFEAIDEIEAKKYLKNVELPRHIIMKKKVSEIEQITKGGKND